MSQQDVQEHRQMHQVWQTSDLAGRGMLGEIDLLKHRNHAVGQSLAVVMLCLEARFFNRSSYQPRFCGVVLE